MKTSQRIFNTVIAIAPILIIGGINSSTHAHEVLNIPQDFFSIQNSAREFFKDGQEQLETEIEILNRRGTVATEGLLHINEDVVPPQQEQLFEIPDGLLEPRI